MKILKHYPDQLTNKLKYDLTMSPKTQKMQNADGSVIEISAWAIYTDTDKDDTERTVLCIRNLEGETFATNSATFIRDFERMLDLFDAAGLTAVEVISGTSKSGRRYLTCSYAGE